MALPGKELPWIVDGDGHVREPDRLYDEFLPSRYRHLRPRTEVDGTRSRYVVGDVKGGWKTTRIQPRNTGSANKAPIPVMRGEWDPLARLEDMHLDGISHAVLFPTQGMAFGCVADRDAASALSRAYNDWLGEYCSADPERPPARRPRAVRPHRGRGDRARAGQGGVRQRRRVPAAQPLPTVRERWEVRLGSRQRALLGGGGGARRRRVLPRGRAPGRPDARARPLRPRGVLLDPRRRPSHRADDGDAGDHRHRRASTATPACASGSWKRAAAGCPGGCTASTSTWRTGPVGSGSLASPPSSSATRLSSRPRGKRWASNCSCPCTRATRSSHPITLTPTAHSPAAPDSLLEASSLDDRQKRAVLMDNPARWFGLSLPVGVG